MYATLIARRVERGLAGTAFFLSVLFAIGCGQQGGPSGPAAPVTVAAAVQPAPIEASVEPQLTVATAAVPDAKADTPKGGGETVQRDSCDGEHTVTVAKDLTGQPLAEALMDQWQRNHPEANWVAEQKERHGFLPPADNSDLLTGGQGKEHVYGNYSERDILTWAREAEKLVAEGSRIFHDADALGSTVAVSCDMCHPHAANTHPETYPKFQTQLGRTVLLRDMINWCIENPVRGPKLAADSPEMRALEGYIMAQRKGVKMNYGKH